MASMAAVDTHVSLPGLVDLPDELFALVAPYLTLKDIYQLRATCRKVWHCSAVLARACQSATRQLKSDGEDAPRKAVLAWAMASSSRYIAVFAGRGEERKQEGTGGKDIAAPGG